MRAGRRAGDFPVPVSKRRSGGGDVLAGRTGRHGDAAFPHRPACILPGAHDVFPAVPRARAPPGRLAQPAAIFAAGSGEDCEQAVMALALGVQALLGPQGAVTLGCGELLRRLQPGLILPG